ncbi:MAG: C39 family peptidase [Chloroflexi bacterium]|nr:C39 family peptidase [Chloroflexota bacterium]
MADNPLNVPYIHQIRDTPTEFNGNWACGPTSVVMALAAYGALEPRNDGKYGWYVSNLYTNNKGITFNHAELDPWGHNAFGAYGYCTLKGVCWGNLAAEFAIKHGIGARSITASRSEAINQLQDGKPVVIGTTIKGFGHVILLKGVAANGHFICNDPYWRKPGGSDDLYTWGELGSCPFMVVFDRALPSQPTAPAPQPEPAVVAAHAPSAATQVGQGLNEIDTQRFVDGFVRNGGQDKLGLPTERPRQENGLWLQNCPNGDILILDTRYDDIETTAAQGLAVLQPAFVLRDPILKKWYDEYKGVTGPLGAPVSDIFTNLQDFQQCSFEGGYIIWDGSKPEADAAYGWPSTGEINSWKAEYWNNPGLASNPAFVRDEPEISYDFGEGAPEEGKLGIIPDMFSARWTRKVNFDESGDYVFTVTVDDGFRLYIDGVSVVGDQYWTISAEETYNLTQHLEAGEHEIKLEYFEAAGKAVIKLNWQKQ